MKMPHDKGWLWTCSDRRGHHCRDSLDDSTVCHTLWASRNAAGGEVEAQWLRRGQPSHDSGDSRDKFAKTRGFGLPFEKPILQI